VPMVTKQLVIRKIADIKTAGKYVYSDEQIEVRLKEFMYIEKCEEKHKQDVQGLGRKS